ncbi:MAG: NAD(P)-dependent oxidoreductase [Spirochaetia bacterium]|nr:NAD(P)-dependent oxidoreductase [Spirochaetia bacterium]
MNKNEFILSHSTPIGFLGLGIMGMPLVKRLIEEDYNVIVYNRTNEKALKLKKEYPQIKIAESYQSLAESAEIIFLLLSDNRACRQVLLHYPGNLSDYLKKDQTLVNLSTISPELSMRLDAELTCSYLEAPLVGSKQPAEQGELVLLTAGYKHVFEALEPIWKIWSKKTYYLGDVGTAARFKLVNNLIMSLSLLSLSEGMALAENLNLDMNILLDLFNHSVISSPLVQLKAKTIKNKDFTPNFPLKHAQKDLKYALRMAEHEKLSLPSASIANEIFKKEVSNGSSDDDFSAVSRYYQ